jgi:hypothetical protein
MPAASSRFSQSSMSSGGATTLSFVGSRSARPGSGGGGSTAGFGPGATGAVARLASDDVDGAAEARSPLTAAGTANAGVGEGGKGEGRKEEGGRWEG